MEENVSEGKKVKKEPCLRGLAAIAGSLKCRQAGVCLDGREL
jgi:hypothetical protein